MIVKYVRGNSMLLTVTLTEKHPEGDPTAVDVEVTTLPLQFLTIEPEGLDFYKGNMLLHLINESKLRRIVY